MRSFAAIAASLLTSLVSLTALANESGLAGYTGKPNLSAPAGESCNNCHTGGTAPQVTLVGPSTLAAGQTADYSLVIKTASIRAAGGIAATDGIVLTPGAGVRDSFGEMVPNGGVATNGGQATFAFKVTAPLSGTTLRLWAVGLSANGNGATSGDKAAQTLRDIAVTGGAPPKPDAGTSGGADASTPPPPGADGGAGTGPASSSGAPGSSGSSGGASPTPDGSSAGDGLGDPASPGSGTNAGADGASCAVARAAGAHAGEGLWLAVMGVIPLLAARRRRRAA